MDRIDSSGDSRQGGMPGLIQWMMWYLIRPGGLSGGGGRAQPIANVMKLTLPQMIFFSHEKMNSDDSFDAKQAVDEKWHDPKFRDKYAEAVKRRLSQAKAGLAR